MSEHAAGDAAPEGRTLRHLVGGAVWSDLLTRAYERSHPAGATLLRQDEPGTHVLALVSGVAKVVRRERDGALTLLAFRGPGELLGEVAVLDDQTRSASVHAISRCVVGVVTKADFLRFTTERDLFPVLVRYALAKLRESDQARGGGDVAERIAATLVALADMAAPAPHLPGGPLDLALTRHELAQHLRLSRNTISSALTALEPLGVRPGRGHIVVGDPAALRRVVAGGGV
ncbi:Crp/Fnr family transcriptional regulator [Streptomyces yaizuensis]|uniref:Cyclic nucleotide-binding domain-containing protein n=1 Tax=Streptomyces yaizuensis TaxID=2989713 RepID=A0ABQ5NRD6_9ACTN|nr:Crp/Fnr family transcriptional regulator [Streptomyces sp. YSPA8]GLF92929.1 cyclic nucleotide-binding domain-containing protein [Streptomyces sp. YSPA8]